MPVKKQDYRVKTGSDMELTILLSIVNLIGIGICVTYLSYGENLYSVGEFWLSPVLITLICNELGKYLVYTTLYFEERTLNPRDNMIQRKRKSLKNRIMDVIKFSAVIGFFLGVYGLLCICLGAPVLDHHEETLTLASVLTILTVFPVAIFLGASGCLHYIWAESLESSSKVNIAYVNLAKISAAGAIFGAWSGSIAAPLDWDRRWQIYPIPNVVGALLGYTLVNLAVLSQKLISRFVPSFTFIP